MYKKLLALPLLFTFLQATGMKRINSKVDLKTYEKNKKKVKKIRSNYEKLKMNSSRDPVERNIEKIFNHNFDCATEALMFKLSICYNDSPKNEKWIIEKINNIISEIFIGKKYSTLPKDDDNSTGLITWFEQEETTIPKKLVYSLIQNSVDTAKYLANRMLKKKKEEIFL